MMRITTTGSSLPSSTTNTITQKCRIALLSKILNGIGIHRTTSIPLSSSPTTTTTTTVSINTSFFLLHHHDHLVDPKRRRRNGTPTTTPSRRETILKYNGNKQQYEHYPYYSRQQHHQRQARTIVNNSHQKRSYHISLPSQSSSSAPPPPPSSFSSLLSSSSAPPAPLHEINLRPPIQNYTNDITSPLQQNFQTNQPLLFRGGDVAFVNNPNARLWKDTAYLESVVGSETPCDVEIGGQFDTVGESGDGGGMVTSKIQFGDYISYLDMAIDMAGSNEEDGSTTTPTPKQIETQNIVYLAQNDLFDGLMQDFTPPSFCTDGSIGRGDLYATKIWIGPLGTVSPLHYDPLDNVVLQFVGEKVVTLYPPIPAGSTKTTTTNTTKTLLLEEKEKMEDVDWYYAGLGPSGQKNVAAVDIERPDFDKYPNFRLAPKGLTVRLGEGDMLFIPKRWWHHVRGDSVWSMSLNCWWD